MIVLQAQKIQAANFGGYLTCPLTGNLCFDQPPALIVFPKFTSVSPTSGTPGTFITIKGEHFEDGMQITVANENLENLKFVDNNTYTGNINSKISVTNLIAQKYSIIITDPNLKDPYQSDINGNPKSVAIAGVNTFTLQVPVSAVTNAVIQWLGDNPVYTALICVGIVLLIGICAFIIYRERQKARYGSKGGLVH